MMGAGLQRIVILGNAGSGKTTLARQIGQRIGLPVTHLDALFWQPGWVEPEKEAFRERVRQSVAGDGWVSEGNYARKSFDLRLARADLVIWLDTATPLCLWRITRRVFGKAPRPDLPAGCAERIDRQFLGFLRYVATFNRKCRPAFEAERLRTGSHVPVLYLRNRHEIACFLDSL